MPNALTALGLTTLTRAELLTYFETQFRDIYGADVNLDSDSPDGQWINILVQSVLDLEDLLTQIYNAFDPDFAIGNVLDQRCAINGVTRRAGTYTVTNVTITNNQSVNLYGLDQTVQPVYTVADSAGNRWLLQVTRLGLTAGAHALSFRAEFPGANLTVPNTITIPVSIILGVTAINNPTLYTTLGVNEETDQQLRIRRQKSVSLASQGYLPGLLAALEGTSGVSSAQVYENDTSTTDGDGIPGHSIWVIVAGSATSADIAQAIYNKRNAGCGMKGDTSYQITQVDGTLFTVKWDGVVTQNLFIAFTATSLNGTTAPNLAAIRAGIAASFAPGVHEEVNINELATLVQSIDSNTLVTGAGFSAGTTQVATLSGVAASGTFKLNYNGAQSSTINWNDAIGTIQGKVQAMTGLSAALVTGSIASQTLTINLSAVTSVNGLFYVTNNSLLTGGSAAITFSFNEGYSNTLTPLTKKNQFSVAAANVVILAMQLSPSTSTVVTAATVNFTGLGGYGAYTYSILTNNSGASINASTGVYTAGSTPNVTDTVKAVDVFGNSATATVAVTS